MDRIAKKILEIDSKKKYGDFLQQAAVTKKIRESFFKKQQEEKKKNPFQVPSMFDQTVFTPQQIADINAEAVSKGYEPPFKDGKLPSLPNPVPDLFDKQVRYDFGDGSHVFLIPIHPFSKTTNNEIRKARFKSAGQLTNNNNNIIIIIIINNNNLSQL